MKLKAILFNVALATFTICSAGRIAASQMSNPSSTPTGQEASQPVPLDQQALAWIKKLSEATVTEQTLEEASKFHQENLATLSDERFQELSHAIADKESETARRVLRDASLVELVVEAKLQNPDITKQPAKRVQFVNTPDLTTLIAHATGKEKTEIESCLKPCSLNEQKNTLNIDPTQYWALSALSELDSFEEPTVDSLRKSLRAFEDTFYTTISLLTLNTVYELCLEALIKTKNEVQQFSYDNWLKAFALYCVERSDYYSLCGDKLFINQQDQKLSLAQWIINNIRLSEAQKKELLNVEAAITQERQERESLSEARAQSQPQIRLDAPAPIAEQQTSASLDQASDRMREAINQLSDSHPQAPQPSNVFTKTNRWFREHSWARYTAYILLGGAAVYGGYRWYKHINVSKLARTAGKWA